MDTKASYRKEFNMTVDDQIDVMYKKFDDLFHQGKFEEADQYLVQYDCGTDIALMLALLTITLCAKTKLPSRPGIVACFRSHFNEVCPGRTDRLLRGLV